MMLLLYSTNLAIFSSAVMYNFVGVYTVVTLFLVYYWMKDVINEKEFDERRASSRSTMKKVRFTFVLK